MRRWRSALREHAVAVALVTITVLAAAVRFSTLGVQSLDHDETVTAAVTLHPSLHGTWDAILHSNERTPPLYFMLLWLWAKPLGAGMGPLDLRAFSALLGTLTVPVAFLAARELGSRRAGVIAAALVALNPFLVWYSQEARSYALLALLLALGLYLFARALRDPTRGTLALWALSSMLALATHYFAVFAIAPEAIWLSAVTRPRGRVFGAIAAIGAAGMALVALAVAQERGGHTNGFAAIPVLERAWQALVHFTGSYEPTTILAPSPGVAAIQVVAGVGGLMLAWAAVAIALRRGTRGERRGALAASSVAAGVLLIPLAMALGGFDFYNYRNLIGAVVPLLVAAAIPLGSCHAGRLGVLAAAGACALFAGVLVAVNLIPEMQRVDFRAAADDVGPAPTRRVLVVPRVSRYAFRYYLHATPFEEGDSPVQTRRLDLIAHEPLIAPPAPAFRRVAFRQLPADLWLARYVAPREHTIRPRAILGERLIPDPDVGMITAPQAGAH